MIKYFIPEETIIEVKEEIRNIKFHNDYNKAIFSLDSSKMDLDKQIIHRIIKLKESVYNNIYSNNEEELCVSLLYSLEKNEDNIYIIKKKDEELLLAAIATVLYKKTAWFNTLDRKESPNAAMDSNYTIIIKAIKSIKVIHNDDVSKINEDFNKFIETYKPLNMFLNDLKETNMNDLELVVETNSLSLNTTVSDIKITENAVEFVFKNGKYVFDKNKKIYPIKKKNSLWSYELDNCIIIKKQYRES